VKSLIISLNAGLIAVFLSGVCLEVQAKATKLSQQTLQPQSTLQIAQADESAVVKENQDILLKNRELARKIATKLGITSTGDVPTTGMPLEQNQILIMQNQETFKAIAEKVGATMPALSEAAGADTAEKNHNLLLQNRQIVVAILEKLEIAPAAAPELTGSFVQKNNVLLKGNAGALAKIAAKLAV
jgi:hypothetical protein